MGIGPSDAPTLLEAAPDRRNNAHLVLHSIWNVDWSSRSESPKEKRRQSTNVGGLPGQLMTRWSMESFSTFAMVWNPMIWSTLLAPSSPKAVDFFSLSGLDLRPCSLRRGGAAHDYANLPKNNPQKMVKRSSMQAHLMHAGYSNSETFLQIVSPALLPSISTQKRYHQAGECGKTHVFYVLAVSFVRGSARLWPGDCSVIHCMPGSG